MATDKTTFSGYVTDVNNQDTYQELTTKQEVLGTQLGFACFNKLPFLQVIGVEAWGIEAVTNLNAFGAALYGGGRPKRMITRQTGHSFKKPITATSGTSYWTGRNSSYGASYVAGGDQSVWAHHQLVTHRQIPEMDILDNETGKIVDLRAQTFKEATQVHARDFSLSILGNSAAPSYGVDGPSSMYSDLPNLVSVTQTRTVGGIATTNSFWANQTKNITSLGGGGDLNRPLALRYAMIDALNDAAKYAEASERFLLFCNQGFYQTMGKLAYADTALNGGVMIQGGAYDGAGIRHMTFAGNPLVWDQAVTLPYGATASKDFCYALDINNFFISLHKSAAFSLVGGGWEGSRVHDNYRNDQMMVRTRLTPYLTSRRTQLAIYGVPANSD